MYNKVRKALNDMGYIFKECDKVEFSNGIRIRKCFRVERHLGEIVYVEITDNGELEVWGEACNHLFTVRKKEIFLMMFELGWILND